MNKLVLVDMYSDNVNIHAWEPVENEIDINIMLEVGYADKNEGINNFYFNLTSPQALLNRSAISENNIFALSDHATIVIGFYDYQLLKNHIESILNKCSKHNFEDSCDALLKYFNWEYDEYK